MRAGNREPPAIFDNLDKQVVASLIRCRLLSVWGSRRETRAPAEGGRQRVNYKTRALENEKGNIVLPPRPNGVVKQTSWKTRFDFSVFVVTRAEGVEQCGQASKGVWGMSWHQKAKGRGRLRKVRGSCQTSFDPGIPELTQGTETSHYLEEEKETSIPSVAASESGEA